MMRSLFLDTSENLVLGILDENFSWVDYLDTKEKKGSGVIHGLLFELLKKNSLSMPDIDNIFIMAGPGSYTGMRLGEGLAQVLELFKVNIFSTYHFDIPLILNVESGSFASKAFKGEVFVYSWEKSKNSYQLILEDKFKKLSLDYQKNNVKCYTHVSDGIFEEFKQTSDLIKENPKTIFKFLFENNIRKELFYYRPLELEFKQTAK